MYDNCAAIPPIRKNDTECSAEQTVPNTDRQHECLGICLYIFWSDLEALGDFSSVCLLQADERRQQAPEHFVRENGLRKWTPTKRKQLD